MRAFFRGPMPFLCVGHSFDHMFTLLFTVVVLEVEGEFGLSFGEGVRLAWLGLVLFGVAAPLAGWLADKWSDIWMMVVFFIGIGLSTVGVGLASTPTQMFICLSLIGLFASIYHPVGIPMVMRIAGQKSGRMLGINGVFGSYGMALASGTAALMIWLAGWRMAYLVPGGISIALGIWFAFRFGGLASETNAARRLLAATNAKKEGLGEMVQELGLSRFLQIMGALSLMTLGAGLVFQCMTIGLPKILQLRVDWIGDSESAGFLASVIFFLGALAQLAGGFLADKFPLKWLFIGIYSLMTPALILAALASNELMILALFLIMMITVGNQPVSDFLFSRYVPKRWVNTAFGFRFALSLGTAIIAVPLMGEVFDRTGDFYYAFLAMACAAIVAVLAALILPNRGMASKEPAPVAAQPAGAD
ncbi:MAG: MFS transporter [Alphaproteobacteria bacterium]